MTWYLLCYDKKTELLESEHLLNGLDTATLSAVLDIPTQVEIGGVLLPLEAGQHEVGAGDLSALQRYLDDPTVVRRQQDFYVGFYDD